MSVFLRVAPLFLAGAILTAAVPQAPKVQLANVTLHVVDSYGHTRPGCRVIQFQSSDPYDKTDYHGSFSGLSAARIPIGTAYSALLRCADGSVASYPSVSITHAKEYLVIVSWIPDEDYVTGPAPRLTVSVSSVEARKLPDDLWIKSFGVYLNDAEVAPVDIKDHKVGLFSIVPGTYLIALFEGERIACMKQINFLGPHAKLALRLSADGGCSAEVDSQAELVP